MGSAGEVRHCGCWARGEVIGDFCVGCRTCIGVCCMMGAFTASWPFLLNLGWVGGFWGCWGYLIPGQGGRGREGTIPMIMGAEGAGGTGLQEGIFMSFMSLCMSCWGCWDDGGLPGPLDVRPFFFQVGFISVCVESQMLGYSDTHFFYEWDTQVKATLKNLGRCSDFFMLVPTYLVSEIKDGPRTLQSPIKQSRKELCSSPREIAIQQEDSHPKNKLKSPNHNAVPPPPPQPTKNRPLFNTKATAQHACTVSPIRRSTSRPWHLYLCCRRPPNEIQSRPPN